MIALALAAAIAAYSAPVPVYRDTWISPAIDFPQRGINSDSYTLMTTELTVNPHGGLIGCRAKIIAGNAGMGRYTCALLKTRALFEPARDPSGRRMYGIDREVIGWALLQKLSPPVDIPGAAQFEVKVSRLPSGMKQPARSKIQFAVDVGGSISSCSPLRDDKEPALAQLACGALGPAFHVEPALDNKGRPVPSVQNATVELKATGAE